MAEIVNLRRERKRKEKADHEAKAEQNRLLFGRTKAERLRDEVREAQAASRIEGHRIERKPKA